MAFGDLYPPYMWPTNTVTHCGHGTPPGVSCWYCQHPATGLAPQTFSLGGWQCPGCRRGYNPAVLVCEHCGPKPAIPAEDFTGGPEHDLCVPVSEGGLCDHDDQPQGCTGGRHCSC